jgi:hypothetical protein
MFQNVNRFFDSRDSGVLTNTDDQWQEVARLFHTIENSERDKGSFHWNLTAFLGLACFLFYNASI